MNFPENLKYTQDHEWIKRDGTAAFIGITDFAQGELGDIVYVDIPTVGQEIKQNEIIGSVEAVKTVSDIFSPVSARIVEVNPDLQDHPELVNSDPYGAGWMVKVELLDAAQLDSLLDA